MYGMQCPASSTDKNTYEKNVAMKYKNTINWKLLMFNEIDLWHQVD